MHHWRPQAVHPVCHCQAVITRGLQGAVAAEVVVAVDVAVAGGGGLCAVRPRVCVRWCVRGWVLRLAGPREQPAKGGWGRCACCAAQQAAPGPRPSRSGGHAPRCLCRGRPAAWECSAHLRTVSAREAARVERRPVQRGVQAGSSWDCTAALPTLHRLPTVPGSPEASPLPTSPRWLPRCPVPHCDGFLSRCSASPLPPCADLRCSCAAPTCGSGTRRMRAAPCCRVVVGTKASRSASRPCRRARPCPSQGARGAALAAAGERQARRVHATARTASLGVSHWGQVGVALALKARRQLAVGGHQLGVRACEGLPLHRAAGVGIPAVGETRCSRRRSSWACAVHRAQRAAAGRRARRLACVLLRHLLGVSSPGM